MKKRLTEPVGFTLSNSESPVPKEPSLLCYRDASVSLCHPNISDATKDQDLSQITQRKLQERKNIEQNKTPPCWKPERNSKTSPRNTDGCMYFKMIYLDHYLIVPLVSLVSSVPLRDYRPFLIWKTKIKYNRTVSVVMPACSYASFSH